MANSFRSASRAKQSLAALVNTTKLTGLLLSVTLSVGLGAMLAQGSRANAQTDTQTDTQRDAVPAAQMSDGVYLYGQSAQPQTIGSEYLVFEVNQGTVVGGFYMPNSSFDCFYGNLQADKLALNVVDSYERTIHPYSLALAAGEAIASTGGNVAPLGLEGYHRITSISELDQRILTTCKADQTR